MTRTIIFVFLAGCTPSGNVGQAIDTIMPACIIACKSSIDAVNAQPNSVVGVR